MVTPAVVPPLGMLAELTHRCPLHCPYCSNPIDLIARAEELTTEQWLAVLDSARDLGILQVHMSGGEPLARPDLVQLVTRAANLGCYVNLVTSGLGLTDARMAALVDAGLAHVQLSIQAADAPLADRIAGTRAHTHKLAAAARVKQHDLPLTVNAVLHRANHHQLEALIALAEHLDADRLELANTQYYGWGLRNRAALMPTPTQLAAAEPIVRAAKARLRGRMDIVYVVSDYYEPHPKPCMYGWGSRQLTVAPNGDVLPCPAASAISTLKLDNVLARPLAEIWYHSDSFNAFRGEAWMSEPCRTCPRRTIDYGGCRCQAFLLTGDATATDPVCSLSPHRHVVDEILGGGAPAPDFVMRPNPATRAGP
jgi:PqqA peptide cyclase